MMLYITEAKTETGFEKKKWEKKNESQFIGYECSSIRCETNFTIALTKTQNKEHKYVCVLLDHGICVKMLRYEVISFLRNISTKTIAKMNPRNNN